MKSFKPLIVLSTLVILTVSLCFSAFAGYLIGDADGDGELTNTDLVAVARYVVGYNDGGGVAERCDLNFDGVVDNSDLVAAARVVVGLASPVRTRVLALDAGHSKLATANKCDPELVPAGYTYIETLEWYMNDRVCDMIEESLEQYNGVTVVRTSDTDGNSDPTAEWRADVANDAGADLYVSIHHNEGIAGGTGGGIETYVRENAEAETLMWQKTIYEALIARGGLKGDRTEPLKQYNFIGLTRTNMPAVLLELGFMDSATDVPVILTDEYARLCADAIVGVLVEEWGLIKLGVRSEELGVRSVAKLRG